MISEMYSVSVLGSLYIALIIVDLLVSPMFSVINLTVTISKALAIYNDRFSILVKIRILFYK